MSPGFDPDLDGRATPRFDFPCREFSDGTVELIYPDGEIGLYTDIWSAAQAVVGFIRAAEGRG